ncbi:unnamed protein product [Mycena citricolor]|uniref:Uncharacterized protein n=1 Tax=Mycena citricolor TaxID=2018698 RepID=A0AAD2K2K8_9AGAR|nr:unnamed protein product [Mycena citricolor]
MAEPAAQPNPAVMSASLTAAADNLRDLSAQVALLDNLPVMNIGHQLQQLVLTIGQLTITVNANHQAVLNNHAALVATVADNHQTALDNHAALVQRLNHIQASLALQPMKLANAAAGRNSILVGPNLAPLANPHPQTREVFLSFTIAQCQASTAAFVADGHPLQVHPNGIPRIVHLQQLALFLGIFL